MASGFDIIKRGILSNDMKMVLEGYCLMTNDDIELPVNSKISSNADDKGVTGTGIKKRGKGTTVKVSGKNLFVDVEGEAMAKKKPAKKTVKSTQTRDTIKMLNVKCVECSDKFIIRQDYLEKGEKYVCNNCIITRARKV